MTKGSLYLGLVGIESSPTFGYFLTRQSIDDRSKNGKMNAPYLRSPKGFDSEKFEAAGVLVQEDLTEPIFTEYQPSMFKTPLDAKEAGEDAGYEVVETDLAKYRRRYAGAAGV